MANSTALTVAGTAVRQVGELYSLNDLHRASGGDVAKRPGEFMRNQQTLDLVREIENAGISAFESRKGRNGGTYACRELVVAYAAWIDAPFHLKVLRVFLAAVAPTMPYSIQPGQTLSAEQADALRNLLTSHVQKLPKAKQGVAMVQGWSKLKAHFKTDYRHIPAGEFHEAVSIIARHTSEWELVDDAPTADTLNQTVADWVQKIEEKNGYPALIFMPLVEAVQRKLGGFSKPAALPRLRLQANPPARGTYKFNSANPYPRDGRTIEVAKSIVTEIRDWSDSLPAGPARHDLHDAAQTLYDLLVSGWTEVDEALSSLSTAVHYLNRWQGRGGGVGNVRY